jgi:hypothetical protein
MWSKKWTRELPSSGIEAVVAESMVDDKAEVSSNHLDIGGDHVQGTVAKVPRAG